MNSNRRLLVAIVRDKELLAILSGIVLSGIGLISLTVTAGVWYF